MTNWEKTFLNPLPLRKILLSDKNLSLKTWSRASTVTNELLGLRVRVHNGKDFVPLLITAEMHGHKLGEFLGTRARYEFKKKKKKK
jgi:small subunit ribosomal protein S19